MGHPEDRPLVLIVDDDEDHGLMLEALLDADGYQIVTATSRAQAQALLQSRTIDVLVADLSLGDGTALDLVRDLGPKRPRVAIVLSGFDAAEDIARTLEAGFDAHLAKPTPLEELRALISNGLRRRPSGVRLTSTGAGAADGGRRRKRSSV